MGIMGDKQVQNAGDASTQMQAEIINVYNGIDEKRARDIVDEKLHDLMSAYTCEAHNIMAERVQKLADDLVPKLVKENLLENFGDPSFQLLLLEAEKSAASTEREADTELLSELLIHRIKKGKNRNIRAGINQAIKIVDEISDEALLGLTVVHTILSYGPAKCNLNDGLEILSSLFSSMLYDDLPKGDGWLDHLDILNAIRINPVSHVLKIRDLYARSMAGFIDLGIKINGDTYQKALEILDKANLPQSILIPHELRDGYVRLGIVNIAELDAIAIKFENIDKNIDCYRKLLNEVQKQAFIDVYNLYEKDEKKLQENKDSFMEKWNSYDSLREVREWWDSIKIGFSVTAVGNVLGHANAKRCNLEIPELK